MLTWINIFENLQNNKYTSDLKQNELHKKITNY